MSAMSDYLEAAVANAALRGTTFTAPSQAFLALCTSAPSEAVGGNINETTYSGYARVGLGTPSAAWTAPTTAGLVANVNTITFPAHAGGASATITHWALLDGSGGGANLLFSGAMTTPKTIEPGDVPSFPPSSIQLTFA